MGVTVEVNSLEEMCDMMCDNKLPEEKEQWWVFTFGYGQEHAGQCVKIRGTFDGARSKMINKYGTKWAFQYSQEQWERIKNDPLRNWPMETAVVEGIEENGEPM